MKRMIGLALVLAISACASAPPAPSLAPEKVVEQFMWNYTATWNKHDSATIARDFYRMGAGVPEQTESLEKGFVNLRTQGYHHSDIHEIKACIIGGGHGLGRNEVLTSHGSRCSAAAERPGELLRTEEVRRRMADHKADGRRCRQTAGVPGRLAGYSGHFMLSPGARPAMLVARQPSSKRRT
jgi:hypothetical protein